MLRIGLDCTTTKTLFVVTVSIQIDTDVLSVDAAAPVKKCRVLFSIRRVLQPTNLYTKPNGPFGRLLPIESMYCCELVLMTKKSRESPPPNCRRRRDEHR